VSHNPELLHLMPIESRIVLLTAGDGDNDPALRTLLQAPFSWEQLLVLAEWERTLPWSWLRIRALGAEVPAQHVEAFERLSRVCEFHSMMLEERLRRLLTEFGKAGIRVILLKGAALGLTAYRSFAERPMGDLDLLISPDDAQAAWDIALSQGWNWDEHAYPREHYQAHHHLPPLTDATRTGARLELHTGLSLSSHPYALSFEKALKVSRPVRGTWTGQVLALDGEHALIHLAVHFAWAHLASLGMWRLARDIGALAAQGLDWSRVLDLAAEYKAEKSLYWSLRLTEGLCGVHAAPAEVLEHLRPSRPEWLLQILERHLALHVIARYRPCPSEKWRRLMWSLALDPSRTATSSVRPWHSSPMQRPVAARLGFMEKVGIQLARGRDWRRYLGLLRSAS
jgi:hypothetical protein